MSNKRLLFLYVIIFICTSLPNTLFSQEFNPEKIKGLVVGIGNYQNIRDSIPGAVNDAKSINKYIVNNKEYPVDTLIFFQDSEATEGKINTIIWDLCKKAEENDYLFFYFSGHGDAFEDQGYFLLWDAPPFGTPGGSGKLDYDDMATYINRALINKAFVFLIIDACHAGIFLDKIDKIDKNIRKRLFIALSSISSEESQQSKSLRHGVFTYCLLDMLYNGSGDKEENKDNLSFLCFDEINGYLKSCVKKYFSKQEEIPLTPIPVFNLNDHDNLSLYYPLLPVDQSTKDSIFIASEEIYYQPQLIKDSFTGTGLDVSEEEIQKEKKSFNDMICALNDNRLLDDTDSCAISIYRKMSSYYQKTFKNELAFKLIDDTQPLMNNFLTSGNAIPNSKGSILAAKKLNFAIDLLEGQNPEYLRKLKARQYFLEAYSYVIEVNYANFNKARKLLDTCIILDPKAAYAYNAIGELYYYDHKFDKAEEYFHKALNLAPHWLYAQNNLGQIYIMQERLDEAKNIFDNSLATDSLNAYSYYCYGWYYDRINDYRAEQDCYFKGVEIINNQYEHDKSKPPFYTWLLLGVAYTYDYFDRSDSAEIYYRKAYDFAPENIYAIQNLASHLIGEFRDVSINKYNLNYEDMVNNINAHCRLLSEAQELLNNALEKYTNSNKLREELAYLLRTRANIYNKLSQLINKTDLEKNSSKVPKKNGYSFDCLSISHHTKNYLDSMAYMSYNKSINESGKAIKIYPKEVNTYKYLSYTYSDMDSTEKEKQILIEALKAAPDSPVPYELLGDYSRNEDQYDAAVQYYLAGLEKNPHYVPLYNALYDLYLQTDKDEKAKDILERGALTLPKSSDFKYRIGLSYLNISDSSHWRIRRKPSFGFRDNKESNYSEKIQKEINPDYLDSAIYWFNEALAVNPNHTKSLTNLIEIHFEKDSLNMALFYFRKLDGDFSFDHYSYKYAKWRSFSNFPELLYAIADKEGEIEMLGLVHSAMEKNTEAPEFPSFLGMYFQKKKSYYASDNGSAVLEQAKTWFKKAIDIDSSYSFACNRLIDIYIDQDSLLQAMELYPYSDREMFGSSELPEVIVEKADELLKEGNTYEAVDLLGKAIKVNWREPEQKAKLNYKIALLLLETGRKSEAISILDMIPLDEIKDNLLKEKIIFEKVLLCQENGEYSKGLKNLQMLGDLVDFNPKFVLLTSFLHYRNDNIKGALSLFENYMDFINENMDFLEMHLSEHSQVMVGFMSDIYKEYYENAANKKEVLTPEQIDFILTNYKDIDAEIAFNTFLLNNNGIEIELILETLEETDMYSSILSIINMLSNDITVSYSMQTSKQIEYEYEEIEEETMNSRYRTVSERMILSKFGEAGLRVYDLIDGIKTAEEIMNEAGVSEKFIVDLLDYLVEQELVTLDHHSDRNRDDKKVESSLGFMPKNPKIHFNDKIDDERFQKGIIYFVFGYFKKASVEFINSKVRSENQDDVYLNLALSYFNNSQYDEALFAANNISSEEGFSRQKRLIQLNYKYMKNEFEGAIKGYTELRELGFDSYSVYYNRGLAYACLMEYGSGIKDYTRVLSYRPFDYEAYDIRGLMYDYSEKLEEAIEDYEKALLIYPQFKRANNHLEIAKAKNSSLSYTR